MPTARWTRRGFATAAAVAAGSLAYAHAEPERPNILWITCEDASPTFGMYGDRYATTPNLDRLAARGLTYRCAWSNAPVCAPARTTIITGLYPVSTGSEHMRSITHLPPSMPLFPYLLRQAGYYATNNVKEDYNVSRPDGTWDDSSRNAHWRNRKPGQPFFSVFNFEITHESRIRSRPHTLVHDPAAVRLPAYHPDTPEVRRDWAQYYDNLTTMDQQAAAVLKQLEDDGLAESTIVFFFGDHGAGMPRSKRCPMNSGLQVPMVVYFPDRFRHLAPRDYRAGSFTDRMVGFVDLAPTVLTLAGLVPPAWMQGRAFAGPRPSPGPEYLYGFRGRMDERYDMIRSVRDRRYVYVRNFLPHRSNGDHLSYMFETPTTAVWKRLYDEGKLSRAQKHFWEPHPPEELYDLENDPDEVNNLAASPQHTHIVKRMRRALADWQTRIRDVGFLPEEEIHSRSQGSSPWQMAQDNARYPMARIMETASLAAGRDIKDVPALIMRLAEADSAVRYWAATGLLVRGAEAVKPGMASLRKTLADPAACVRVPAAEALARWGGPESGSQALAVLLDLASVEKSSPYVAILALNALDSLPSKTAAVKSAVGQLKTDNAAWPARIRQGGYPQRLIAHILGQ